MKNKMKQREKRPRKSNNTRQKQGVRVGRVEMALAAPLQQSNAPKGQIKPLAVPASERKFLELIKAFGTKMNMQFVGSDNYSNWLQKLQKLSARLKCKTVLTARVLKWWMRIFGNRWKVQLRI
jgi:hypothetical protein